MATRRAFLAGLAAATVPRMSWADTGNPAYLAAGKHGPEFVLHGLSELGESLFHLSLPARGHAAAAHPTRAEAVAFARRPGTFALVLDCPTGQVRHRLTPPDGRQFNGHGAFSVDGNWLMTSEVIADGSDGRIGLWDTRTYTRVGEWASGGIGPHDLRRMADGRIIVANGGIQTDPNDRTKLNIATMRPNLTLLSPDGAVLDQVDLPAELHQNSIRHLALAGGRIAFAMQWEGEGSDIVPLLGFWTPGKSAQFAETTPEISSAMKGYAGSIAISGDGAIIALTSSKGGAASVFDGAGKLMAIHRRADLSGAAPRAADVMLSDGQGALWACDATGLTPLMRGEVQWDNHLVALTA
jgi:uncharacterized protein